jgi:hypothetical protein
LHQYGQSISLVHFYDRGNETIKGAAAYAHLLTYLVWALWARDSAIDLACPDRLNKAVVNKAHLFAAANQAAYPEGRQYGTPPRLFRVDLDE